MSWEAGGGVSVYTKTRGGGGVARVAAFHMPWEGRQQPSLPPKPGLTGKGGEGCVSPNTCT